MTSYIEYDGIKFWKLKDGYYECKGMRLHRYIWEKYNGCKIPEGYIIHHKNENKKDNDLSNLELMTKSNHTRLHSTGKHHNLGTTLSEEHKQKLSDNNSRYWAGKTFSEEHKEKIGEAKKGISLWPEGRVFTEEHKSNIALSKMGNTNMLGKHHTEETKLQMSITRKGRVASDETKAKISVALKGKKLGYKYELTEEMIIDIDNGLSRNKFAIKYGSAEPWRRHKSNI